MDSRVGRHKRCPFFECCASRSKRLKILQPRYAVRPAQIPRLGFASDVFWGGPVAYFRSYLAGAKGKTIDSENRAASVPDTFRLRRVFRCDTISTMFGRISTSLRTVFLALLLMAAAYGAQAQVFDLRNSHPPTMSLDGLWRFHLGDDPQGTLAGPIRRSMIQTGRSCGRTSVGVSRVIRTIPASHGIDSK